MEGSQRCVVISADGHCGAQLRDYKPYLETRFHEEFEDWAATYRDAWEDVDLERDANNRMGTSSFNAPLNWDSDQRLLLTEDQGIAAEVLFPNTSPPFIPSGSISAPGPRSAEEYEHRFAGLRAHNRWLADFCAETPGRRAGFAQIFLDDVDAAIAEVRWAKDAGLGGVLLPGDHVLKLANLYYPRYDPFWQVCAELDLPVHRHGVTPAESPVEGGDAAPWIGSIEAPFYHLRAIAHVLCAGVFERFPTLKFVTTEALSTTGIPGYLAKLDRMWEAGRARQTLDDRWTAAADHLRRPPSEYFATNCYVSGPLDLRASWEAGTPNLLFGADLPHGEGTSPYTNQALRCLFAGMPELDVLNITSWRAASVYGFDLGALQTVAERIGPTLTEITTPLPDDERPLFPSESRCLTFARPTQRQHDSD